MFETLKILSYFSGRSIPNPLQRYKELLGFSTFGQKAKETEVRDVVCLDVMPLRSGKVLTLEAYVAPVISRVRNEHIEVVKHNFPHLKDLWFSDRR